MRFKFLHLHLHGLIRSNNLELGRDADTGGQTQYVLELIKSLANTSEVDQVDLVTRLIKDPKVEDVYSQEEEFVDPGVRILRFKFGPNKYLRKELLWPYLDYLTERLISYYRKNKKPNFIHAHYADAVYVANELGETLKVWGFKEDEIYASKIEKSFPKGTIDWMGFLSTNELQEELGKCRALLNTPKWNEAFGNVVVEALACGVPVIAYKRGGPSEIIQHGQTGYLADPDDKKNMLSYVEIIEKIKRNKCREWVEKNASTDVFATKVVNWLNKVIHEYKKNK